MKSLLFVFSLFLFACCNQSEQAFPVYNLLEIQDETTIAVSDLVTDIRIVPLETRQDILIAPSRSVVSDKYIIILGHDAIHVFDAVDGRYLKKLAVCGRGPNEYQFIYVAAVDDAKDILYYSTFETPNVNRIHIATGEFLPPIVLESKNGKCGFRDLTASGDLYVEKDSNLVSIYQVATGNYIPVNFYPRAEEDRKNLSSLSAMFFNTTQVTKNKGGDLLYNKAVSDTIYICRNNKLTPLCSVILKEQEQSKEDDLNGIKPIFSYMDSQKIILSLLESKITRNGNSVRIGSESLSGFIIDKEKNTARKVREFMIDPLFSYTVPGKDVFASSFQSYATDKYLVFNLSAGKALEHIGNNLAVDKMGNKELTPDIRTRLMQLQSLLTEDSNPVFIIGIKK